MIFRFVFTSDQVQSIVQKGYFVTQLCFKVDRFLHYRPCQHQFSIMCVKTDVDKSRALVYHYK